MNDKVRVLQVFGKTNRGGAESMLMNIYRNIDRQTVDFDFVNHTTELCDFDSEINSLGGKIYHMPHYSLLNHRKFVRWWECFFDEHNEYSIVHCHIRSVASIIMKIARKHNVVTIAHSHNTSNGHGVKSYVKKLLQKQIVKYADYCLACSEQSGKWLFGNRDFSVVYNAIDVERYAFDADIRQEVRYELNIPQDAFVIGHVGRFTAQKNHRFIIEIFDYLNKKFDNSYLMLIGKGELFDSAEHTIKKCGLKDRVGLLYVRDDIDRLMQAMDVFLMPSLWEGLPVALIEAQSAGLKCVITDNISNEACATELIERVSLAQSAERWADRIISCSGYERCDMSQKVAAAGFDVKSTAKQMQDFYIEGGKIQCKH